jgi:hypothetical protein
MNTASRLNFLLFRREHGTYDYDYDNFAIDDDVVDSELDVDAIDFDNDVDSDVEDDEDDDVVDGCAGGGV